MIETTHVGIGIDTPEDLEKARRMLLVQLFLTIGIS
jgi:3-deoxy-manno-octulosonate cytidylyltransferase (CMP-KDO synthetase)